MALVAEQLTAAGFTGVIEGVRSASPPSWWPSPRGVVRYTPTVYIAWSFDRDAVAMDEQRESHWHVPPEVKPTIVEHAARWAESGGDRALVSAGSFKFQARPPFTEVMQTTLAYDSLAGVVCDRSDIRWSRHANLGPQGGLVMQEIGDTNDWRARIDSMRAAIVEHAHLAAWFASERPDPRTVEQARADFGPMILTRETIALNPPPWRPPGRDPWVRYLPG
jgi:hypothetical protein